MSKLPENFRSDSREMLSGVIRQLQLDHPEVTDMQINVTLTCWLIAMRKGQLDYPTRSET